MIPGHDESGSDDLRGLDLPIGRIGWSALLGQYRGTRPGAGLELRDLKPYEPGDDVRAIDASSSARQGRLFVRRFDEDRSATVWLIVDRTPSMEFGSPVTKRHRANQLAAILGWLAAHSGDQVALAWFDGSNESLHAEIHPATGRRAVVRLAEALTRDRSSEPRPRTWDLGNELKTGDLAILVSDFLDPPPPRIARRLASRSTLVALRVLDRHERDIPSVGQLFVIDAETNEGMVVDTPASLSMDADFKAWASAAGALPWTCLTDDSPVASLRSMLSRWSHRRWLVR